MLTNIGKNKPLGKLSKKKTEDLVNLALFPLGPPLPTQIVKNIIVKIGPYS